MSGILKRFGAITLALALVAVFAWVALTQGPMAPPKVVLAQVRVGDLAPQAFGIGTAEARYSFAIGTVQAGRLLRVLVDQGDMVCRGQLLAEVDAVDLDERLAAARSAVAHARQQLAHTSANRYRELARVGFISKEELDVKVTEAGAIRHFDRRLGQLEDFCVVTESVRHSIPVGVRDVDARGTAVFAVGRSAAVSPSLKGT